MTLRVRALSPTGDMTFGQGSANYLVDSPQAVAQIVQTTLKLWRGEWFLALNAGVPYMTQVVGRVNSSVASMVLQDAVLAVPGVVNVGNVTVQLNNQTRQLSVTFQNVQTIFASSPITQITSNIGFYYVTTPSNEYVVNANNAYVTAPYTIS